MEEAISRKQEVPCSWCPKPAHIAEVLPRLRDALSAGRLADEAGAAAEALNSAGSSSGRWSGGHTGFSPQSCSYIGRGWSPGSAPPPQALIGARQLHYITSPPSTEKLPTASTHSRPFLFLNPGWERNLPPAQQGRETPPFDVVFWVLMRKKNKATLCSIWTKMCLPPLATWRPATTRRAESSGPSH